jgi:hypothetical protein
MEEEIAMRDPELPEVLEAIDIGIRNAQKDYKEAYESHINNSEYSPEYLMTVYIFQSLLKLKKHCGCPYGLSLEEPVFRLVSSLREKSANGRYSCGRYRYDLRVGGKCDLSLRNKDDEPMAAIKVKEDPWDYDLDIKRLASLVERGLPFGIFASCYFVEIVDDNVEEADIRLEEEAHCIHKDIIGSLGDKFTVIKNLGVKDIIKLGDDQVHWRWCPFCYVISDKRK